MEYIALFAHLFIYLAEFNNTDTHIHTKHGLMNICGTYVGRFGIILTSVSDCIHRKSVPGLHVRVISYFKFLTTHSIQ